MNYMRSSWRFAIVIAMSKLNHKFTVRESKISDKLWRISILTPIRNNQRKLIYIYRSLGTKKRPSYYVTNELHYETAVELHNQLKKGVLA